MFWRYNSVARLRELEDKNLRKVEDDEIRERASMEPNHTTKQGVIMILKGVFCALTLTAFEYALKNPEITGYLRLVLRVGFFGSLAGILYIPYGISNLIKSFMRD